MHRPFLFDAPRLWFLTPHLLHLVMGVDETMSNMENLDSQLSEKERQRLVHEQALSSIRASKVRQEAQGYAVMAGFLGYGEGALGQGVFGKASHVAKLFCILFAMLAPSLLIWSVLL